MAGMKNTPQQTFKNCLAHVLLHEGGYVNDPKDPGGETNFGISKRQYPTVDIAHLTRDAAADIYEQDYWRKIQGDSLPPAIALAVFDTAVNCGVSKASRMLQESCGAAADGVIGLGTLQAIENKNPVDVVQAFMARRAAHYANIVIKNPTSAKFLFGWYRRCFAVHGAAMKLLEG